MKSNIINQNAMTPQTRHLNFFIDDHGQTVLCRFAISSDQVDDHGQHHRTLSLSPLLNTPTVLSGSDALTTKLQAVGLIIELLNRKPLRNALGQRMDAGALFELV